MSETCDLWKLIELPPLLIHATAHRSAGAAVDLSADLIFANVRDLRAPQDT
jgi:hypothetical protein